jgi:hypothetical protein
MNIAEKVSYIIQNGRHPIERDDYYLLLGIVLPVVILLPSLLLYVHKHYDSIFVIALLVIVGFILFQYMILRIIENYRFEIYPTGMNVADNIELSKRILSVIWGNENIKSNHDMGLVIADTFTVGLRDWDLVYVICLDGKVLINSKPKHLHKLFCEPNHSLKLTLQLRLQKYLKCREI